jgi:hypothetical protein
LPNDGAALWSQKAYGSSAIRRQFGANTTTRCRRPMQRSADPALSSP